MCRDKGLQGAKNGAYKDTPFQRSELALRLKPKLEAQREQGKRNDLKSNFPLKSEESKEVNQRLGEIAGVGKDTIRNTETILTKGTPEDIAEVGRSRNVYNIIFYSVVM